MNQQRKIIGFAFSVSFVLFAAVSCAFQVQPTSAKTDIEATQTDPTATAESENEATERTADDPSSADDMDSVDDEAEAIDDEIDPTLIVEESPEPEPEPEPEPDPAPVVKDWTYIVYMAADNNLESAALADFNELESVDIREANINVLVLLDRADGYDATNGNWTDTRLFSVCYDESASNTIVSERLTCADLGLSADGTTELDMANKATLSALIGFAGREYPAEHYALIVWGHGTGWRYDAPVQKEGFRAVAIDQYADTYMTIADLRAGIEQGLSAIDGTEKLDFVGFDTCFGICMETAYELKHCARYLAGTSALVPEGGWNYADLLSRFVAGEKTLSALNESALLQYRAQYSYYGYASFSVVDCAQVDSAVSAFNAFAHAAAKTVTTTAVRNTYRALFQSAAEAYYAESYPCDFYVDVENIITLLSSAQASLASSANTAIAALKKAVSITWNARSPEHVAGIGVFYAVALAEGIPDTPHPTAYVSGSRSSQQSQFVQDCTGYVPTASCSGSLLDTLFYTKW